ncbi:Helix-turn-helix domain protein [Maioricimonas rarisocia]|uniref:Helix-turn-helix domain protein n=1 Tax=Maioricimonas rarisocia TaxID=2528026 RepID=A0A517Z558_9PLAN|nr:helix-turn-helix domain-containing protein [Maioricimonas rarisocia]QDU37631.1 Helix-turn-helix domain protein [Maioricimonas rarisocia]
MKIHLEPDDLVPLVREIVRETLRTVAEEQQARDGRRERETAAERQALTLRPREAAKLLGISERTLWSLTQPRGPIPSVKLGRRVAYPVDLLREWLLKAAKGSEV